MQETAGHNSAGNARERIAIGPLDVSRADIVGFRLTDVIERDSTRKIASLALLCAAAMVLALGILPLDWRHQAMLAMCVLAVVAVVCGLDVLGLPPGQHYRIDLLLSDGRLVGLSTTSAEQAEILAGIGSVRQVPD